MDFFLPVFILAINDENDREFMTQLYMTHHLTMYRVARYHTSSLKDAEDVVQDTCEALIQKIPYLRTLDERVLEGYIVAAIKNRAITLHRRKQREFLRNERIAGQSETETLNDPEDRLLEHATIEELMYAISVLPEEDQMLLRMKYFEEDSDREIARAFGIQEVSVRSRLTRVRGKIRKTLEEMNRNE